MVEKEDITLLPLYKKTNLKNYIGDIDADEMKEKISEEALKRVEDYLNWKLKDLYSEENNPDDPFTANVKLEKIIDDNDCGVNVIQIGDMIINRIEFDCDRYRFAGSLLTDEKYEKFYFSDEI